MKPITPTYKHQVSKINAAAAFFAVRGYYVDTTFYSRHNSMEITIHFHDIDERKKLELSLRRYAGESDDIIFNEHKLGKNNKFYTLTLYKNAS